MKLFIYCFREFDEKQFFDELQEKYDFTYEATSEYPNMENARLAEGFDAISTTVTDLNGRLLERFASLGVRCVSSRSIGVDHIDLKAAERLGLRVFHVSYGPESVADYAVMMLLMSMRNMRQIMDRASVQDFSLKGKLGRDIGESTVGVMGTGRIGSTVIRHLKPFGCRILACDSRVNPALSGLCEYVTAEELYRESDAITLHIPAAAENFHLIDRTVFRQLKPGCILVNTARGTLVDTEAMIEALEQGILGGAALDVIEEENGLYYLNRVGDCIVNRQMAQLRMFPNVILTPHTAFYTEKTVREMAENTVKCMFDLKNGISNPLIVI
ncbi:MAG: NAD(P)-dependent oxidoreductase [Enterocloster sp.]